jgi:hypothetical protein
MRDKLFIALAIAVAALVIWGATRTGTEFQIPMWPS